jgi:phosphate transport system permease protein
MTQRVNLIDQYPNRSTLGHSRRRDYKEQLIKFLLRAAALVSVLTTVGIIAALIGETIGFFREVPLSAYFGSTRWSPTFSDPQFGVWPLISATLLVSVIALLVAVPLGLVAAIFLSEFASPRVRGFCKPALELLAGIPTVVYGFFALSFITPILDSLVPGGLPVRNALGGGIAVGILIIPLVSSLTEEAMHAVPRSLREGAYGLGATRFEVATRVVFPAALSGIVAAVILALSIAIGETMIVAIAVGGIPRLTADPTVSMQTMTAFIAAISTGDAPTGSIEYRTLFAVGTTLFVITFTLNVVSHWIVGRFREVYD